MGLVDEHSEDRSKRFFTRPTVVWCNLVFILWGELRIVLLGYTCRIGGDEDHEGGEGHV